MSRLNVKVSERSEVYEWHKKKETLVRQHDLPSFIWRQLPDNIRLYIWRASCDVELAYREIWRDRYLSAYDISYKDSLAEVFYY